MTEEHRTAAQDAAVAHLRDLLEAHFREAEDSVDEDGKFSTADGKAKFLRASWSGLPGPVQAQKDKYRFWINNGRINGPQKGPMRLGAVGGRLVAETFAGLLGGDPSSILYDGNFHPDPNLLHNGKFGFKDLIEAVTSSS